MKVKKGGKPLGWTVLNNLLRNATEKQAKRLMDDERAGEGRIDHVLRCYKRYNKMRRDREMKELTTAPKSAELVSE
jgi:hypothetical protein